MQHDDLSSNNFCDSMQHSKKIQAVRCDSGGFYTGTMLLIVDKGPRRGREQRWAERRGKGVGGLAYLGLSRRRHKGLLGLELCWWCLDRLCKLGCRLAGLCRLALCPSLRGRQGSRSRQGRLTTGHCLTHCTCHTHTHLLSCCLTVQRGRATGAGTA